MKPPVSKTQMTHESLTGSGISWDRARENNDMIVSCQRLNDETERRLTAVVPRSQYELELEELEALEVPLPA